ncbi:MAG: hypothetical protein IK027_00640 [Deltaproteobacteria bacterium]|nr:hypothetical protein [Deltaproteobacteria bacterium]
MGTSFSRLVILAATGMLILSGAVTAAPWKPASSKGNARVAEYPPFFPGNNSTAQSPDNLWLQGQWNCRFPKSAATFEFQGNTFQISVPGQSPQNGTFRAEKNTLYLENRNGQVVTMPYTRQQETLSLDGAPCTRTGAGAYTTPSQDVSRLQGIWTVEASNGNRAVLIFQGNRYENLVNNQLYEAGSFRLEGTRFYAQPDNGEAYEEYCTFQGNDTLIIGETAYQRQGQGQTQTFNPEDQIQGSWNTFVKGMTVTLTFERNRYQMSAGNQIIETGTFRFDGQRLYAQPQGKQAYDNPCQIQGNQLMVGKNVYQRSTGSNIFPAQSAHGINGSWRSTSDYSMLLVFRGNQYQLKRNNRIDESGTFRIVGNQIETQPRGRAAYTTPFQLMGDTLIVGEIRYQRQN